MSITVAEKEARTHAWKWLKHLSKKIQRRILNEEWFVEVSIPVSSEMARELLDSMKPNRNKKAAHSEQIYRAMCDGTYADTSETIKIDPHGQLFDGEHRLEGVWRSGLTISLAISFNEEPAEAIDGGVGRTAADVLKLSGEKDATSLAALARCVWYDDLGEEPHGRGSRKTPSKGEIVRCARTHPELHESVEFLSKGRWPKGMVAKSYLMWMHWKLAPTQKVTVERFLSVLKDGIVDGSEPSPAFTSNIILLRKRVSDNLHEKHSVRKKDVLAWLIKTWNASLQNQAMKVIRFNEKEAFPSVLLEVPSEDE